MNRLLAALLVFASVRCARAQGLLDDDLGDIGLELTELSEAATDYDLLRWSHLSEVDSWSGVQPLPKRGVKPEGEFTWEIHAEAGYGHLRSFCSRVRQTVSPLGNGVITTTVSVPEAATYRVWLCYQATPGKKLPLRLVIGKQALTYGEKTLTGTLTGKAQEESMPICFESEQARLGMPYGPVFLWEYHDLELPAEALTVSLQSDAKAARVDALFITRSKSFRPSKALVHTDNTLGRSFLRYRLVQADQAGAVRFHEDLTFHWRHYIYGEEEPRWYWHLEADIGGGGHFAGADDAPVGVGEWSRWLDAGGAMLSAGPYATEVVSCTGASGNLAYEVQMAWYPHEAAVVKTVPIPVAPGVARGLVILPLYYPRVPLPSGWGMRDAAWLAQFRNALEVAAEQQAVVDAIDLPEVPLPLELTFTTGCGADPVALPATARMLRSLGVSHIAVSRDLQVELGLRPQVFTHHNDLMFHTNTHCPLDPLAAGNLNQYFATVVAGFVKRGWAPEEVTLAKFGDEIGAIRPAAHVNRCSDCRHAFITYLEVNFGGPDYFGEEDWDQVQFTLQATAHNHFARRLYYACAKFNFDYTADFYRLATVEILKHMPRARTYCNFSPHPVIMGGSMNHSDWFNLTRRGGTNYAWGEDWASNSSWGFWMGMQIVSYYAAWVECAARGTGHGGGFYAVGGSARQQFSCIAHGLDTVQLYSFGPQYAGAEASNFWSENHRQYADIAAGLHAIGPADRIIARGDREPAAAAILYNRDHEIWHEDLGMLMQVERVGTFVALEHAGVPTAVVIEADLLEPAQIPWPAVYINGFNLSRELVAALRQYVEGGGVVVATAGTGSRDRFDDQDNDIVSLLGATTEITGRSEGGHSPLAFEKHEAIDSLQLDGVAAAWPVIGMKSQLTVAAGADVEILGRFKDNSPGLIRRRLGQGEVYVYAVHPGIIYRATAPRQMPETEGLYTHYDAAIAAFIAAPVRTHWSRSHRYSHPLVETRRFDYEGSAAITLNSFYYRPVAAGELRIRWPAGREPASVQASLAGPLKWTRDGDWIVTELALPGAVDTVVVK